MAANGTAMHGSNKPAKLDVHTKLVKPDADSASSKAPGHAFHPAWDQDFQLPGTDSDTSLTSWPSNLSSSDSSSSSSGLPCDQCELEPVPIGIPVEMNSVRRVLGQRRWGMFDLEDDLVAAVVPLEIEPKRRSPLVNVNVMPNTDSGPTCSECSHTPPVAMEPGPLTCMAAKSRAEAFKSYLSGASPDKTVDKVDDAVGK